MLRHYGIIGNPVEQSFSARYFTEKFEREGIPAEYQRYRCETIDEARVVIKQLDGCNVTIPHKQAIIPLLDALDETAREIGAVNVVKQSNCQLVGYNTDYMGFMESIRPLLCSEDKQALVLGTGGAAKAIHFGLRQLGIKPIYVSRTPQHGMLGYEDLTEQVMLEHTIIVNCTPLGMWPNTEGKAPIPYSILTSAHLLYDCVYNPEETVFLREGRKRGARVKNGMQMLIEQAEAAWKIWN